MNLFTRIRRELWGGIAGVREGVLDLAERVNEKMQIVKLSFDIQGVQQLLEEQQIAMGKRVYQLKDRTTEELASDEEVRHCAGEISRLLDRVSDLERAIETVQIGGLKGRLMEWREDLQTGKLTLYSVTISPTAPVVGKALMDLTLPRGVIPLTIVHRNQVLLAGGETILYDGDRITFLGHEDEVEEGRRILMG